MPLRTGAVGRRRALSMTSLIDVIFLLLLFFMLSSTFTRFSEIPLTAASAGMGAAAAPPLFLQLGADDLRLNGARIELSNLIEQADQFLEQGDRQVLVALGTDVSSQRLVDLMVQLASRPELSVTVLQ